MGRDGGIGSKFSPRRSGYCRATGTWNPGLTFSHTEMRVTGEPARKDGS